MLILLVASLGAAGLSGDGDAPEASDVTLVPEDEVSVQDDGDVPGAGGAGSPSGGASRATTITTLTTLCNASGTDDGDQYGFAVSMGDIDGDGLSDVVASAPLASVGAEPNAGKVYVHWGEQMLASAGVAPSTAQTTLLGESAQANFGWSLSEVKDYDGDDLGDLLVGSPGYAGSTGRASLFRGSEMDDGGEVDAVIAFDGGTAGDQYGWSVAFAGDVDGDGEVDAIIGAPGADRAYLYFGPVYDPGDRIILTGTSNSDFGHCVAGAGDINDDGFDDLAIGAPSGNDGTGEVKLVFGYDGIEAGGNVRKFNNTLKGESVGDQFGHSVVSGRLDSDKKGDLLIGGPGADRAFIYYGKDIGEAEVIPYLWNWPGDAKTPIGFQSGVYNDVGASQDVNTYGLGAGDDGWDWNLHTFGYSYSMSAVYGGTEGDGYGTTLDGSTRLEAIAGPTHTSPGYSGGWWGRMDSASWGIEFSLSQEMYEAISGGGSVTVGFDWEAQDTSVVSGLGSTPGGGTEEPCYVKARFSSASDTVFLGEDLGGDSGADIMYDTGSNQAPWGSPEPNNDSFSQDVTAYVTGAGSYYLEMGVLFDCSQGREGEAEGIIAYFDDIWVKVRTGAPDFASKIIGTAGTMFGGALSLVGDLDDDGRREICVGSPDDGKGSLEIFSTQTSLGSTVYSTSADIRNTGGVSGEDFAWSVAGVGDLNGDGLNDIIAGSPRKKSSSGLLTVLTPNQIPSISWVKPEGGDVLKGKVSLEVHCADDEDGSDIHDVYYWYMEEDEDGDHDTDTLTLIGYHSDSGTDSGNVYSMKWNTKPRTDANYYLMAEVTDTVGLESSTISDKITVNNPDTPEIEFLYPSPGTPDITFTEDVTLFARATDPDGDIIGVNFYSMPYTEDVTRADLSNWTLISTDYSPSQDVYNVTWSTRMVVDGQYLVMAIVSDDAGLEAEVVSLPVLVNNPDPPLARVTYPGGGETLSGTVTIEAKVTDADNNVVSDDVFFSVTQDELKLNWTDLGVGAKIIGEDDMYSIQWDTTTGDYPDGVYWARVRGADQTGTVTYDSSESFNIDNPSGPSVAVEQVPETVSGTIMLKATVTDPDSGLSDEGVRFYWGLYTGAASDLRSRDGDVKWKLVGTVLDSDTLLGNTYSAVWDTTAEGVADGTEYYIKAWVKDSTLLEASGYSGKFEVNNPDPPQIFMDIKEGHLKGTVYLNATVDDPDGPDDIDDDHHRGVSFFYSSDNITWHFIDNDEERDNATETPFYSIAWDTRYLEDEEVTIKAVVVDKTGLMAEDYEEGRTVQNLRTVPAPIVKEGQGENFLWLFLILLILIIAVSASIAAMSYKKAARRKKLRDAAEKEEAVQRAKMELLRDFPVSGTPYSDMLAAAGQMPMMLGTGAPMGAAGAPGQPQLLLPAGTNIPVAGSADAPVDISGMEAAGAGPYTVAAAQMQGAQAQPGAPGQPGVPLQTQQGVMPMGGVGQQMYVMPQNPYAMAQQMYMQMQMQQMAQNMGVSPPASGQTIDVSQPQAPVQAAAPQQPATQPTAQQPVAAVAPTPQTPVTVAPGAPVVVTPAPGPAAPGTPPKKPTEGGGA